MGVALASDIVAATVGSEAAAVKMGVRRSDDAPVLSTHGRVHRGPLEILVSGGETLAQWRGGPPSK